MNNIPPGAREIESFRSLFKGREDVFAICWKKGNKSGYMPAYQFDPYMYRLHKMRGGTISDYKDKSWLPLTDKQVLKHLNGEQLIGIYPLLENDNSWFIAADFDKERWAEESLSLIRNLSDNGIPAYLERSKSGRGGHVLVFFDKPYPAVRSRKIMTSFLERAGVISVFDKNSSFDRLFPNQDRLSGQKLGNLIALPLYKAAFSSGNSCFVDEEFKPHRNQWEFLRCIKRVDTTHLDIIYRTLSGKNTGDPGSSGLSFLRKLEPGVVIQLTRRSH